LNHRKVKRHIIKKVNKCAGPGGEPGSDIACPTSKSILKFGQGDLWFCKFCEEKLFGSDLNTHNTGKQLTKEAVSEEG